MLEGVESLLYARLTEYIRVESDQLSGDVVDLAVQVYADGEDYTGWSEVWVEYTVPKEIARFGYRKWRFQGDLLDLIRELDRWKARQS